jgi:Putative bacterial sensory transduction regulator
MSADAHHILPVTQPRMIAQLHELGIRFHSGDNDEIVARFGDDDTLTILVAYSVDGPVMCMRSQATIDLGSDEMLAAPGLCNEWNGTHRFPNAMAVTTETECSLLGSIQVPAGLGLTDLQLRAHLEVGTAATMELWLCLQSRFEEIRSQLSCPLSVEELEGWLERGSA